MTTEAKFVNTLLDGQYLADFERVKAYHGLKTRSETIRFLIKAEVRRIESDGRDGPTVRDVIDGYLAGQVTAYEAMEWLSLHRDLVPA